MGKIITALFGVGFFGSILAMRKYLGITLLLITFSIVFKNDIIDYMKQNNKQNHEQRLAEIKLQTEQLKIVEENRKKIELEQQKKIEQEKKVQEYLLQQKKKDEQKLNHEQTLYQQAKDKMCNDFYIQYTQQLACAINSLQTICAQGYNSQVWFNSANQTKNQASSQSCPVNKPEWK